MLDPERLDFDFIKRCRKRKEKTKGISVAPDRLRAEPSNMREVLIEKLTD